MLHPYGLTEMYTLLTTEVCCMLSMQPVVHSGFTQMRRSVTLESKSGKPIRETVGNWPMPIKVEKATSVI